MCSCCEYRSFEEGQDWRGNFVSRFKQNCMAQPRQNNEI
jgi:hypothetical protein